MIVKAILINWYERLVHTNVIQFPHITLLGVLCSWLFQDIVIPLVWQ